MRVVPREIVMIQSRPGMQLCIPRAGLFCYEHLAPVF